MAKARKTNSTNVGTSKGKVSSGTSFGAKRSTKGNGGFKASKGRSAGSGTGKSSGSLKNAGAIKSAGKQQKDNTSAASGVKPAIKKGSAPSKITGISKGKSTKGKAWAPKGRK